VLSKHKSTVDYPVSYYYYLTNRIEIIKKIKFVHVIKFVKVRELFSKCKVCFARAEQLCCIL